MSEEQGAPTEDAKHSYSFEEFRLVYETSERLVEQKMQMTRANSSFCSAIVAGQSIALSWAYGRSHAVEILTGSALFVIALLGLAFSFYWYRQIEYSKKLNSAKFDVMSEIAQSMQFPDYRPGQNLKSINPFDREWKIMEDKGYLNSAGSKKWDFTDVIVPGGFMVVFGLEALVFLGWAISVACGSSIL